MILASIIIPCFNEEQTIVNTLEGILSQDYPIQQLEVIIADGLSTDKTRSRIAEFQTAHPELPVTIIDNPRRTIPSGLNLAIKAATGEFIVRLDAHSIPSKDYVSRCIAGLIKGLGDNIGGVWDIKPGADTWVARSIAVAAASKLGVGDANYRLKNGSGYVDTVPFGAFRKSYLESLGGYDQNLLTNEDYELNTRIRQLGGKVYLDDAIHCLYYARSSFKGLAQQYWRYGYWKAQMLKRYPATIRWRQALPPIFVLGMAGLLLLSFFAQIFLYLFASFALLYLLVLILYADNIVRKNHYPAFIIGIPVAISTMHILWGSGLVIGLLANQKPQTT